MKTRIVYTLAGVLFFLTPLSASFLAARGLYPLGIMLGLILLVLGGLVLSINLRARISSSDSSGYQAGKAHQRTIPS